MRKLLLLVSFFVVVSVSSLLAQTLEWTQEGAPFGALSLAANGSTVFAGTHYQGIFRSTDSGVNWKHLYSDSIDQGITDVNSLAIQGATIFAGTNQGIFLSSDDGDTWNPSAVMSGQNILFTFVNGNSVFAGGDGGIYRSTNGGNSWKALNQSGSCMAVSGLTLYLASDEAPGFFRSTDNGDSWTPSVPNNYWTAYSIATIGNSIFVAVSTQFELSTTYDVYRSADSGKTWKALGQNSQFKSLAVIGDTLFAGSPGGNVVRSTDLGVTWSGSVGGPCNGLAVTGSTLYSASEDAVWRTNDGANTWTRAANGWGYYTSNVIVGKNDTYIFACLASLIDTSEFVYRSSDNGTTWNGTTLTPSSTGLPSELTVIFCSGKNCYLGTDQGVYRSTDNGDTWLASTDGLPPSTAPTRPTIYGFTSAGTTVFAATDDGVYRSIDGGSTWSLTHYWRQPPAYCLLTKGTTVFAGTNQGVYQTTDYGDTWIHIDTIVPTRDIHAMTFNGSTLFAGDSRSTDGGITWSPYGNIFTGQATLYTLTSAGGVLYAGIGNGDPVGTGQGVYLSSNDGDTWVPENDGFPIDVGPIVNVSSLTIAENVICAGTDRGLFYANLANSLSVSTNAFSPNLSVQVFPNPLRSSAKLRYELTEDAEIQLSIYDPLGREVMQPLSGEWQAAGEHELSIDARNLSPGIYQCRLRAGSSQMMSGPMVVMH